MQVILGVLLGCILCEPEAEAGPQLLTSGRGGRQSPFRGSLPDRFRFPGAELPVPKETEEMEEERQGPPPYSAYWSPWSAPASQYEYEQYVRTYGVPPPPALPWSPYTYPGYFPGPYPGYYSPYHPAYPYTAPPPYPYGVPPYYLPQKQRDAKSFEPTEFTE